MIKKLSSQIVYQNKWMTVREDQVEFADKSEGIYGVVEKPDFALIIPFDGTHFYLVKQYRYPVEASFWEFPQGSYENNPALDPPRLAQAELKEETGLAAQEIKEIGFFYEAYGYCNQGFHIFLAEKFEQGQQQLETSEQGMIVQKFTQDEIKGLIETGEMRDAPSISALGLGILKNYF